METDLSKIGVDLVLLDMVDSTNEEIKRRAQNGAKEGLAVMAKSQTSGQGRSGRSFFSPQSGNLYMSILLKPSDRKLFDKITVIAAVATANAINAVFPVKVGIKWVNDLFLNGRKIGGIIAKAENFSTENEYVVLGIGVNIYPSDDVPEEIKDIYGSIINKAGDDVLDKAGRDDTDISGGEDMAKLLGIKILKEFFGIYRNSKSRDFMQEYRNLSCVIGKEAVYLAKEAENTFTVLDIDNEGAIVLKDEYGNVNTYRDGEIRIRIKK